jgi:hypothetical protein
MSLTHTCSGVLYCSILYCTVLYCTVEKVKCVFCYVGHNYSCSEGEMCSLLCGTDICNYVLYCTVLYYNVDKVKGVSCYVTHTNTSSDVLYCTVK